jgi:hypothetical protein
VAADSGGEEFRDGRGADGGQWRGAAHELELEAASGGEPLTSVESRELVQAVLGELAAESALEEGNWVGVGGEDAGEDDVGPGPGGRRCDGSGVGPQLDVQPDVLEVCPDDLAGFGTARIATDGEDDGSGARAGESAGAPEIGAAQWVDMLLAGGGHAGRQVMVGDEVAERRGERRAVEGVVDCLAQPRVGERAVPGVEG